MENIAYKTGQIARYFTQHRIAWHEFYESERVIIERLQLGRRDAVLDIGCGCGGLGLALRERFGLEEYTGVEINAEASEVGRTMNPNAHIVLGDILEVSETVLRDNRFDVVFSLSCVDWNVRFSDMLAAAWRHVLPGGHLVATFRLTTGEGCAEFDRSYQYINYDGIREGERASYIVLNAGKLIQAIAAFNPSAINAYGYWGAPSSTAVTPYERLCFAAFSIQKGKTDDTAVVRYRLDLPPEILEVLSLPPK